MADLEIRDLRVSVEGREILKGVSLDVSKGEVHAVMGPNGSGKSTLSQTLLGHPGYKVEGGRVRFKGQDILELTPDARSRLGLFLALQYPIVVPGITMNNFLRTALNAHRGYDGKDKSKSVSPNRAGRIGGSGHCQRSRWWHCLVDRRSITRNIGTSFS